MTDLNSEICELNVDELSDRELDQVSGGSPKETVTFEYGALMVRYTQQSPDGMSAK